MPLIDVMQRLIYMPISHVAYIPTHERIFLFFFSIFFYLFKEKVLDSDIVMMSEKLR